MDREQEEMQFLGLFGIYKESYKIVFTWRKLLSQITLTLILPLTFIFLVHMEVSDFLSNKIMHNEIQLGETQPNTKTYNKLSDLLSKEWTYFFTFKAIYLTFLLIFSLLSTAAVVYTIASIYTGRDVSFYKVMSVVPKVWKRLMVTFLCMFGFFFVYNVLAFFVFFTWIYLIGDNYKIVLISFIVFIFVYLVGLLYMSILWQLASVVSVLEDACGAKAMVKSRSLIKGKFWLAFFIFLKLNVSFVTIEILFERLVIHGWSLGVLTRVLFGVLCFLLLCRLFLFGLVIQTIIYFMCKSYHHENIDKSALSDHLEVYLGEYVPLKSKDVQLEQFDI